MNSISTKFSYYQLLLTLCIAVPILNIFELTFGLWGITILITLQNRYSFTIFNHILIYSLILIIALFSSIGNRFQMYFYLKDITYMAKPIMGLLIGYQLFKGNKSKSFSTLIYIGLLIAIIHIILVIIAFISGNAATVAILREHCGYFNDFEVYTLVFLLFHKKFNVEISKQRFYLYVVIMIISSFFYLARTNFIQFIILMVALKGYFTITIKSIKVVITVLIATVIGYAIIYNLNPKRDGSGVEQFLYKIKNAPIEPFKTKIDVTNWKDINDNYRSYENILTLRQVTENGPRAIILGEGIGSTVDLKQKMWLQSSFMRYIPFLHNSFMTALLKSGILGVFLLLFYIYTLMKNQKSNITLVQNINMLLIGTGIFLFISNWVFLGMYNTSDNKSILVGFLIAYRELEIQKSAND
jgi:hypothetical protein